jgi:hypothetical protein
MKNTTEAAGAGIYTIHQPNDSEGTAQSHRNTHCHSRVSGNPDTPRQYWIPAYAGMTIYSRCVDAYGCWG